MRYLIILLACVLLYFVLRLLYRQNPKSFTRYFFFALIGLFLLFVFVMAISGKLHWLFALLAGLIPWAGRLLAFLRLMPFVRMVKNFTGMRSMGRKPSPGQTSQVHSQFLSMTLNHDTGEIEGKVLQGRFEGLAIMQLNEEQLKQFLLECQADQDSYALLCSYLSHRFGKDWQSSFKAGDQQSSEEAFGSQGMSRDDALDILGLEGEVTKKEVIQAHRHLMQKFHPDRGGSNYLAAKINEAKDYLLKHL